MRILRPIVDVSDKVLNRPVFGNFHDRRGNSEELSPHTGKRRLVEECESVWVYAVQRAFGKKGLISAIRQVRPFRLPVPSGYFDIWLTYETHRLPGHHGRWSSLEEGTARLWLVCPGCRRKVAKLFYYYLAPGSSTLSDLLCRHCHGLTYQSVNCGGNGWYRQVARPLKRLLREKSKLLARQHKPRVATRLVEIENEIRALRQKVERKMQRGTQTLRYGLAARQRRPYQDLALLDQ